MRVLVSDTSVIIDLERGGLLDAIFRLACEFAVPDLLYARELTGDLGRALIRRGLQVEELTAAEVMVARTTANDHKALSVSDAFAFALAMGRNWPLLTGHGGLRNLATAKQLDVRGVLWVFDQLELGDHVPAPTLFRSLTTLTAHPRCRLPRSELQDRLDRYAQFSE